MKQRKYSDFRQLFFVSFSPVFWSLGTKYIICFLRIFIFRSVLITPDSAIIPFLYLIFLLYCFLFLFFSFSLSKQPRSQLYFPFYFWFISKVPILDAKKILNYVEQKFSRFSSKIRLKIESLYIKWEDSWLMAT